ncbi:hypothetical protein B0H11DRAFT_1864524 [Mycena galericulata]|nr:hypothetical protein B0H11DRAFT_1864524 [Mycena galericulata]
MSGDLPPWLPQHLNEPDEEAPASKLWGVYVSEAEKYDKALVESWKSNMEGMLIFAGLFSASLTAFIIESYPTLVPDSGDSTVHLLNRISQQLAAAANGSTFHIPPPTVFTPPITSLVCNALWFTSLGLSLTCALVATLLEQWARDFLHRADMRSATIIRARIFQYLYYGLKRFSMHSVVDIIPLLLHASLFLFFAGLVAFLIPINTAIAVVAGALLALVTAAYSVLTILPLWYLDCPYRTPLSGVFWNLSRVIASLRSRPPHGADDLQSGSPSQMETIVEAISKRAMEISPTRTARDYRALVWTVKSLADDIELQPFIEALPEVLWGPYRRRYTYDDHIRHLLGNPDLRLQSRISGLLRSCDTGLLSPEASKHREISCYKAIWAIATLQEPSPASFKNFTPIDFSELGTYFNDINDPSSKTDPDRLHYTTSVAAILRWNEFYAIRIRLTELLEYLARCKRDVRGGCAPDLRPVTSYLVSLMWSWSPGFHWSTTYELWKDNREDQYTTLPADYFPPSTIIPGLVHEIDDFLINAPHFIMLEYYGRMGSLKSPPYRWDERQALIHLDQVVIPSPSSYMQDELERVLDDLVYGHLEAFKNPLDDYWVDPVVLNLCTLWRLDQISEPRAIPSAIIQYLNKRGSDIALRNFLSRYHVHLWASIPKTLCDGPSVPIGHIQRQGIVGVEDVLTALWRVLSLPAGVFVTTYTTEPPPLLEIYESALAAVTKAKSSSIAFSVGTMIKGLILGSLDQEPSGSQFVHPLLPTETANVAPRQFDTTEMIDDTAESIGRYRKVEAKIVLVADFLDECSSGVTPYRAAETLQKMDDSNLIHRGTIHEAHQIRLARSMARVSAFHGAELLTTVVSTTIFDVYAGIPLAGGDNPPPERYAWLDSLPARTQIKKTLLAYINKLHGSVPSGLGPLFTRIQNIIRGLDSLHTEEQSDLTTVSNDSP